MAQAARSSRRGRTDRATDEPPKRRRSESSEEEKGSAVDKLTETIGDTGEQAVEGVAGQGGRTVTSELKSVMREAAIEVLSPAARKATTEAAKFALTKGPGLAKNALGPRIEEAGGAGALAKETLSKVGSGGGGLLSKIGLGGGDGAGGTGKGRRLPIQESVDVAVPLETAYNQFTQFEDFPKFMHRVEKIEQRDDTHLVWHENIWGIRRQWEAEITEQRPNERIAWKSLGGTHVTGVITFHPLSDRLTRIEINVDFQPHGLFEKTASGFRMSRRALKSDLMRFKAFTEMREEETGAWRGRIEEGEVVEAEGREEPEDDAREEPEAEEEEEYEEEEPEAKADEEEEEPEPEEEEEDHDKPVRRRPARRRAPARRR